MGTWVHTGMYKWIPKENPDEIEDIELQGLRFIIGGFEY